jgi:hypothetical protein
VKTENDSVLLHERADAVVSFFMLDECVGGWEAVDGVGDLNRIQGET